MKTAIDFYARGKMKESNADDFPAIKYPKNKFVCPECGENVHLCSGIYSNHFSHYTVIIIAERRCPS